MIRVAGAGVAGSYFAALSEIYGREVKVYDGSLRRGHGCAWGCFYSLLDEKLRKVGLRVDDYILCKTPDLILNGIRIKLRNHVSINKPKLIDDLWPSRKVIFIYTDHKHAKPGDKLVVNATATPLGGDVRYISTFQYKARLAGAEPRTTYVYLNTRYVGYAWVFPLDEEGKWYHVGAGSAGKPSEPREMINGLLKFYGFRLEDGLCTCNRPITVVNPKTVVLRSQDVVSVGEAGGFVFPITGEGIIPAMDSAELLHEALLYDDIEAYEVRAREYFRQHGYDKAFGFWNLFEKHPRWAWIKGSPTLLKRASSRVQPVMTPKTWFQVLWQIIKLPR